MSDLVEIIETLLLTPPAAGDADTMTLLQGVAGRGPGQYGARLKAWLESDRSVYPEPVTVQEIDNPDDAGVDVLVTGRRTGLRVGFQIKSDNDLKANQEKFVREAKAQYAEAGVWGLSLYVFVMACRPTPGNIRKYTYLQNTFARMPNRNVLWIEPNRAAGLLRAFGASLPALTPPPKGWAEFFVSARQRNLAAVYLSEFPGLQPHERFQPPSQWKELIARTESHPLTVLTGPPAVGKTFTSMQLLWNAFRRDRKVLWIAPPRFAQTEGPIADPIGLPDLGARVDLVTRELGLHAHRPPLDASEFIAAHLEPGSLVYIEDPFGKTEDEFEHSLHTYQFFDLDRFVAALGAGEPRSGCNILISSREGIFERWLEERRRQGKVPPQFALARIGPDSYGVAGRLRLTGRLLAERGAVEPLEAARAIAGHVDVPFDATLIAKYVDQGATREQVVSSAEKVSRQYAGKLSGLVSAEKDAERLFLLLLSALSTGGAGRYDFYTAYELLYEELKIGGDPYAEVKTCLSRYRPLYTRLEIARVVALEGVVSEHADFHLEAVHSTVFEAINDYLRGNELGLLNRVALALPAIEKAPLSNGGEKSVGMFLLRLAFDDIQQEARDAIFEALYGVHGGAHLNIPELLSWWDTLNDKYRERFFDYIAAQGMPLLAEACAMLPSFDLPEPDAWRMLQLLAESPQLGGGQFRTWGDPWGYVAERIDRIPPGLRRRLKDEAPARPAAFTRALSDVIVTRWEDVPQEWRVAFLHPKSVGSEPVQERVLLAIAKYYRTSPDELRRHYDAQATALDYRLRATAGMAALLAHDSDPGSLGPVARKLAVDPDVRAPLHALTRARGDGDQYRELVETLLARSDAAAAAHLLNILLYDSKGEPETGWKLEAARACVIKGGDLARAVLAFNGFGHPRGSATLGYHPADAASEEPSPTRLAWVWSYANTAGKNPSMNVDALKSLVEGLEEPERLLAVNYLTAQAESLPPGVREFTEGLESAGESYRRAIEEGKANRQPAGHGRLTWTYPSEQFLMGQRSSVYASLLTYQTVVVPVGKAAKRKDGSDAPPGSITMIMIRPPLNLER